MYPDRSPKTTEQQRSQQQQELELNAGLFIWPVIMFVFVAMGLTIGYVFWER
jgi:hypothetical protein